jgi:hypothetical protein
VGVLQKQEDYHFINFFFGQEQPSLSPPVLSLAFGKIALALRIMTQDLRCLKCCWNFDNVHCDMQR